MTIDGATDRPNIVFISNAVTPAPMGGLAGGDMLCNDAATAAGLPGAYVAFLSTATVNAIDRLAGSRGWGEPTARPRWTCHRIC